MALSANFNKMSQEMGKKSTLTVMKTTYDFNIRFSFLILISFLTLSKY